MSALFDLASFLTGNRGEIPTIMSRGGGGKRMMIIPNEISQLIQSSRLNLNYDEDPNQFENEPYKNDEKAQLMLMALEQILKSEFKEVPRR